MPFTSQIAAMPVGSRNSTVQQKMFDPGTANRPTELRTVPSNVRNATPIGTTSEVNQSSSSTVQQTSVSSVGRKS